MNQLEPTSTNRLPALASAAGTAAIDAVRYGIVLTHLAAASHSLRQLSSIARETFTYVEDSARNVDQLAETASTLNADRDTVAEHHDSAQFMRSVLAEALQMANECEEMSTQFEQAKAAHEADYGPVVDAAHAMPVEMADRTFYANR